MKIINGNKKIVAIYRTFRREVVFPRLCSSIFMAYVLIMGLGISGCAEKIYVRIPYDKVEIIANVISVIPLSTGETMQRKRWEIGLRIQKVLNGMPNITPGETVVIQVHSVVKAFGVDVDTIKEKTFYIQYIDAFLTCYEGGIVVVEQSENNHQSQLQK